MTSRVGQSLGDSHPNLRNSVTNKIPQLSAFGGIASTSGHLPAGTLPPPPPRQGQADTGPSNPSAEAGAGAIKRLAAIEQAKARLEAAQRTADDARGRKPGQDRPGGFGPAVQARLR